MVSDNFEKVIHSLTIVSVIAIFTMTIICLASLGFNSRISMEKEKIEVTTNYSNQSNNLNM